MSRGIDREYAFVETGASAQQAAGKMITGAQRLPQAQWHQGKDKCERCEKDFTLMRRKHHCRICGKVLCAACSSKKVQLPDREKGHLSRSCQDCFDQASKNEFNASLRRALDAYEEQPIPRQDSDVGSIPQDFGETEEVQDGDLSVSPEHSRTQSRSGSGAGLEHYETKAVSFETKSSKTDGSAKDSSSSPSADTATEPVVLSKSRPSLVIFGDSLTQLGFGQGGWVSLLSEFYVRKVDIFNRGFSGYNTDWALRYLTHSLQSHTWPAQPQSNVATVVFFGANDSCLEGNHQHVGLEHYKNNLKAMHKALAAHGKVIFVTPPPVDEERWAATCLAKDGTTSKNRSADVTAKYAEAVKTLGKELKVPVVDAFSMSKERDWTELLSDGLHLSTSGNAWLFDQLRTILCSEEVGLVPETMVLDAPHWRSIDPDNPAQAFVADPPRP